MNLLSNTSKIKIGDNIKKARNELGLSQEAVAGILSINRSTYSNYENNIREPNLEMTSKIAKALNTTVSKLLGDSPVSTVIPSELFNEIKDGMHKLGETKELFTRLIKLNGYELIVDDNLNYNIKKDATGEIYSINDNRLDDLIRDVNQFLEFKIDQLIKEGE